MKTNTWIAAIVFPAIALFAQQSSTAPAYPRGYLNSAQVSGVAIIVPAAPAAGDPRFQTDMAIFRETRKLEGSARWKLAQSDDNLSLAGLLSAFACSLGIKLTPTDAARCDYRYLRPNEAQAESSRSGGTSSRR